MNYFMREIWTKRVAGGVRLLCGIQKRGHHVTEAVRLAQKKEGGGKNKLKMILKNQKINQYTELRTVLWVHEMCFGESFSQDFLCPFARRSVDGRALVRGQGPQHVRRDGPAVPRRPPDADPHALHGRPERGDAGPAL